MGTFKIYIIKKAMSCTTFYILKTRLTLMLWNLNSFNFNFHQKLKTQPQNL